MFSGRDFKLVFGTIVCELALTFIPGVPKFLAFIPFLPAFVCVAAGWALYAGRTGDYGPFLSPRSFPREPIETRLIGFGVFIWCSTLALVVIRGTHR